MKVRIGKLVVLIQLLCLISAYSDRNQTHIDAILEDFINKHQENESDNEIHTYIIFNEFNKDINTDGIY